MVEIEIIKDSENERPVPTALRPRFSEIVKAFVKADYLLEKGIAGVSPVAKDTAEQIKAYINDYGEELVELPDATWNSSVCLWMGTHWDVLVDLWTIQEGLSDLVLRAKIFESEEGYLVEVSMVYVP